MSKPRPWPWFPFHVEDWLTSQTVAGMSWAARGVYGWLLCLQWRDGGIESDPVKIRRSLRCPQNALDEVLPLFPLRRGKRRNLRLEEHRRAQMAKRKQHQEDGAKGGSSRGQPRLKPPSSNGDGDGDGDGDGEDVRTSCTNCTEGKIVDDTGKILSCCECPTGRARARWIASDKEGEERSEVRRAADARQGRRGTGPTSLGKGLYKAVRDARPRKG